MQKANPKKKVRKPQHQSKPGLEYKMKPEPLSDSTTSNSGRLQNKVALITGGDSGIGRAVAILFAKEGADIAIVYLNEDADAKETKRIIEQYGRVCELISTDISKEKNCIRSVSRVIKILGRIDILVNNAGTQFTQEGLEKIDTGQLLEVFFTNFFSMVWITSEALNFMSAGSTIINTSSVTAYRGSKNLIDYSSTKGAIVSFTRSLSANLVDRKIRVNGVAPGPVWTPLIVSSFDKKKVAEFGTDSPMKRAGEPVEIAPSYLFLASDDSSFMTGQFLHPNGGEIVNG